MALVIDFGKEVKPFFENQEGGMASRFNRDYEFMIPMRGDIALLGKMKGDTRLQEYSNYPYIFNTTLSRIIFNSDRQNKCVPCLSKTVELSNKQFNTFNKHKMIIDNNNDKVILTSIEDYCEYFKLLISQTSNSYQNKKSLYNYFKYSLLPRYFHIYPYQGRNEKGDYKRSNIYHDATYYDIKISSAYIDEQGKLYLDVKKIQDDLGLYPKMINDLEIYTIGEVGKDLTDFNLKDYQPVRHEDRIYLSLQNVEILLNRVLSFVTTHYYNQSNGYKNMVLDYYKELLTVCLPLYLKDIAIASGVLKSTAPLKALEFPISSLEPLHSLYKERNKDYNNPYITVKNTLELLDLNNELMKKYKKTVESIVIDRHEKLYYKTIKDAKKDVMLNLIRDEECNVNDDSPLIEFVISRNEAWYLTPHLNKTNCSLSDCLRWVKEENVRTSEIDGKPVILLNAKGMDKYLNREKAKQDDTIVTLILETVKEVEVTIEEHYVLIEDKYEYRFVNMEDVSKKDDSKVKNMDFKENSKTEETTMTVKLDKEQYDKLKDYSERFNISVSEIVTKAIKVYLENTKNFITEQDSLLKQLEQLEKKFKN